MFAKKQNTPATNQVYHPNMAIAEMQSQYSWTTSIDTRQPSFHEYSWTASIEMQRCGVNIVHDSSTRVFHQVDRGKGTGKDNIRHSNQFHLAKDYLPIRCTGVHNSG